MKHPFVAVDQDETEVIFAEFPQRDFHPERGYFWNVYEDLPDSWGRIELPKGTIYKLTGHYLNWESEPIQL